MRVTACPVMEPITVTQRYGASLDFQLTLDEISLIPQSTMRDMVDRRISVDEALDLLLKIRHVTRPTPAMYNPDGPRVKKASPTRPSLSLRKFKYSPE